MYLSTLTWLITGSSRDSNRHMNVARHDASGGPWSAGMER